MIIDFNNIEEKSFPAFKGGEKQLEARMYFDGKVRIMKGRLVPGASIGMHTHETNCEIVFVTKGNASVIYNGETIDLPQGSCHYCPKGDTHSLVNNSDADVEFTGIIPEQ